MEIISAILHEVKKERQQMAVVTPRADVLEIDGTLQEFCRRARGSFSKAAGRAFGIFDENTVAYPFSTILKSYINKEISFSKFSLESLPLFIKEINSEPLATGGFILFIHYKDDVSSFMMILQLKLKAGTGIDPQSLALKPSFVFDIDTLHQAARIRLDHWDTNTGKYVGFIKRRASEAKDSTDYFRNFIGCNDLATDREETQKLIRAIKQYAKNIGLSEEVEAELRSRVFFYCIEKAKSGEHVALHGISMLINEASPTEFTEFLDKEGIELSDGFQPHRTTLNALRRVGGKDSEVSLSFEYSAYGTRVIYNKQTGELTIRRLPPALKAALDAHEN